MNHAAERQAIVTAVFAVTGKQVDEDDPIVVAALFQAYTMREATREAVEHIAHVGQAVKVAVDDARKAADEASVISRRTAFDEKARADALEARVRKAVLEAGRVQLRQDSPPTGWHGVVAGLVVGVFFASGAVAVACNFSFSWVSDARLGAEFRRVIPSLEPSLRNKLMKHLEKRRT
jgi:hypothetical protein